MLRPPEEPTTCAKLIKPRAERTFARGLFTLEGAVARGFQLASGRLQGNYRVYFSLLVLCDLCTFEAFTQKVLRSPEDGTGVAIPGSRGRNELGVRNKYQVNAPQRCSKGGNRLKRKKPGKRRQSRLVFPVGICYNDRNIFGRVSTHEFLS